MTRSHFTEIFMILTNYVFDISVWLTEYSVTVGSVTLRFYCRCMSVCLRKPNKKYVCQNAWAELRGPNTHMLKVSFMLANFWSGEIGTGNTNH